MPIEIYLKQKNIGGAEKRKKNKNINNV